jgi:glycosyltransferase involved in cell wall biosynthesis
MATGRFFIVIGPFPPPIHGFSAATAAMRDAFESNGASVRVWDKAWRRAIKSSGLVRASASALSALTSLLRVLLRRRSNVRMYVAVSGGKGQYEDIAFALIGRVCGARIIFHHHSFAYLDSPRRSMRFLAWLGGPRSLHICVCGAMRDLLCRHYVAAVQTRILSNAALLALPVAKSPKELPLKTLGFLGNITLDKGIDRFLNIVAALRSRGLQVTGSVAGPIADARCRNIVNATIADGSIDYHGPVFGDRKQGFLAGIDVLVFPSRYANEAEPFVIIEALAAGIPVIATSRGCIPSLVEADVGMLLDRSADVFGTCAREVDRMERRSDGVGRRQVCRTRKGLTSEGCRRQGARSTGCGTARGIAACRHVDGGSGRQQHP